MNSSEPLKVAIQGVEGCFHDAAAHDYFESRHQEIRTIGYDSFPDMFEAMKADKTMVGVAAIENTIAGSLLANHELIRNSDLRIIGEYKERISHVLCALPGTGMEDIVEVNSHPMALMQCEQWLRQYPKMKMVETFDTAGSAMMIASRHLEGHAAVCGEFAAKLYGLDILEKGIETNKRNFTRFLVLASPEMAPELTADSPAADKASLMFTLPHKQGALAKVLAILAFYDLNLSKIQSTPIIGREWEYRFWIDLTFDDPMRCRQAIEAVRPLINDFRLLGEYRSDEE